MFGRLVSISKTHSFFLFGARGTGKSSLLQTAFELDKVLYVDLLLPEEFATLNRNPSDLSLRIKRFKSSTDGLVIIDEVQRIPKLLDLVHHHIQRDGIRFALTGSSARKLKRGSANLLAGRALMYNLFPLTHIELGQEFSLDHALIMSLLNVPVVPQSSAYGDAFEEWLIVEIFRLIHYRESDFRLSYLRTKDGVQADLVIDRPGMPRAIVEIKSSKSVGPEHVKHLSRLSRELSNVQAYCLSLDEAPKRIDNVEVLPWRQGIRELGIY